MMSNIKRAILVSLSLLCLVNEVTASPWKSISRSPKNGNKFLYLINNRSLREVKSVYIHNSQDGRGWCRSIAFNQDYKTEWSVNPVFFQTVFYYTNSYCVNPWYNKGVIDKNTYSGAKYVYFVI